MVGLTCLTFLGHSKLRIPDRGKLTSYCYDVLDNLLLVNQGGTANCGVTPPTGTGGQTRTFTYNSLKQLLTANNPEVGGLVTYNYYPSGELFTKAAPGVTITCGYDLLGRPTTKSYTDGTPAVSYVYDTVQTGCLTSVAATNGATTYTTSFQAYDPYCAPSQSKQQITSLPDYPTRLLFWVTETKVTTVISA